MADFGGNGSRRTFAKRLLAEARIQSEQLAAGGTSGVSDGDKGDITVSGSGATWTIDAGTVTLAKQANMATASVVYRKTAGTGAPEVQTLATLKTDLGLTGTNSGDQSVFTTIAVAGQSNVVADSTSDTLTLAAGSGITLTTDAGTDTVTIAASGGSGITALTGDVTASGSGSVVATIANGAVSLSKMSALLGNTLIGNNTGSPTTPLALTASQVKTLLAIANTDVSGLGTLATQSGTFSGTSSGTNTGDNAINSLYSGLVSNATHTGEVTGATALTIANDAVTYAKMQNVSGASRLLGRGSAGGSGDVEEVTLGANLTMTGTVLSASSGAGANTLYAPGSFTVATGNFAMHVKQLELTSTQRMTLAGTARFRLMN